MKRLVFLLALFWASASWGQQAVRQNGAVTPGSISRWTQDHAVGDPGGVLGDNLGKGLNPFSVTDASGKGMCINDALTTAGYHQLCLGIDASHGLVTWGSFGGASTLPLTFNVNGSLVDFPGTGQGNILGPNSSTIGHILTFNNTNGTLVQDSGLSVLDAPTTLFVTTGGTDTGDCLVGAPCLTAQYALNHALTLYNGKANQITISLAAGTYSGTISCSGPAAGTAIGSVVPKYILITGASSGTTTVTSAGETLVAGHGCYLGIAKMTIGSSGGNAVFPQSGGIISINDDVNFTTTAGDHMHAEFGSTIIVNTNYTISGSAATHEAAILGGHIEFTEVAKVVSCVGSPGFSGAFAQVGQNGVIYESSNFVSFSGCGTVTGIRYKAQSNGTIETIGGLSSFFPGSLAGWDQDGGLYSPLAKPTVIVTGFGTGAVVTIGSGSTSRSGNFTVATGAAPAGTGTINLTYGDNVGQYDSVCILRPDGAASFPNPQAWPATTTHFLSAHSVTESNFNWSTGAGSLTTPGTYRISYICTGVSGFP